MKIKVERRKGTECHTIRYDMALSDDFPTIWFEVPEDLQCDATTSAEPWLLAALPIAIQTGAPLECSLPVDPLFLENIRALTDVWCHWYPVFSKPVSISVPTAAATSYTAGPTAQFFSGGVDSWFTLLRHAEGHPQFPRVGNVDDLITVWGFDIPLAHADEFEKLRALAREAAELFGKRHVIVKTNIRTLTSTYWQGKWAELAHGIGLAACAHLFKGRYSEVLIGSTHQFRDPFPYGSHPMTDPLFSTSHTRFRHDHALYSRTDKIGRIVDSDAALSRLRVCFKKRAFGNCSVCGKCHRTILALELFNALERAHTFDIRAYERNRDRLMIVRDPNTAVRVREIRELAKLQRRSDIVSTMDASLKRSRWAVPMASTYGDWVSRNISWKLGTLLKHTAIGRMIE